MERDCRREVRLRPSVWVLTLVLAALGVVVMAPGGALAAGRVALVVGNSAYSAIGRLPNAGNDAADISGALRRLGFEVTTVLDADRGELTEALRSFTRESAGADVSLVFYAGHGLEVDGVNYLVPVDARLERDTDVRFETVELDYVLAATVGASLRVVILDACRNNPLARSMQRTGATRSVSRGSFGNLDESLLGDETLVAYAAAAGTTAADGTGRNSPYTSALLAYLEQPLEIGLLFREVRARVLEATGGEQRPHEYASLLGEHYLRAAVGADPRAVEASLGLDRAGRRRIQEGLARAGFSPGPADGVFGPATRAAVRGWQTSRGATATGYLDAAGATALGVPMANAADAAAALPVGATVPAAVQAQQETVFWQSIATSSTAADFEAYLARWPSGTYAPLATNRLAALRTAASDPPAVEPPERAPGDVFRDCPTCPELIVIPVGAVPDGLRVGEGLRGRRAPRARGGGGVVRAGRVRGDVRGVRRLRGGHGPRPTERPGLGTRRAPGDLRVVGGRDGVRGSGCRRRRVSGTGFRASRSGSTRLGRGRRRATAGVMTSVGAG